MRWSTLCNLIKTNCMVETDNRTRINSHYIMVDLLHHLYSCTNIKFAYCIVSHLASCATSCFKFLLLAGASKSPLVTVMPWLIPCISMLYIYIYIYMHVCVSVVRLVCVVHKYGALCLWYDCLVLHKSSLPSFLGEGTRDMCPLSFYSMCSFKLCPPLLKSLIVPIPFPGPHPASHHL